MAATGWHLFMGCLIKNIVSRATDCKAFHPFSDFKPSVNWNIWLFLTFLLSLSVLIVFACLYVFLCAKSLSIRNTNRLPCTPSTTKKKTHFYLMTGCNIPKCGQIKPAVLIKTYLQVLKHLSGHLCHCRPVIGPSAPDTTPRSPSDY